MIIPDKLDNVEEQDYITDPYETIVLSPHSPDGVGTKNCPCVCHDDIADSKSIARDKHCMNCALKVSKSILPC